MTQSKLSGVLVIAASFIFCASAYADLVTLNFNDLGVNTMLTTQYSSSGVDFIGYDIGGSSGAGGPDVKIDALPATSPDHFIVLDSFCNGNGYIQANFSGLVDYVAVDFYRFERAADVHHHLELYDAADNLLASSTIAAVFESWQTLSAQAASPVAYARFYGWDDHTTNYNVNAVRNDNFVFGTAPVPEPATMLLFATGLAGLAGLRLKRRR